MLKNKYFWFSLMMIFLVSLLGYFYLYKPEVEARKDGIITNQEKSKLFKLGLDLAGGSQLVYEADLSNIKDKSKYDDIGESLKEVLTRRLNPFGTSEVSISVENNSIFSETTKPVKRVIIQIPGESNPEEAKKKIGQMPLMEFKIESKDEKGNFVWKNTNLSGANIKKAQMVFDRGEPKTVIVFDKEGGKLFGEITKNNVGKRLGIFLDGKLISDPVINEPILNGDTIVSFGKESYLEKEKEASKLARDLTYGALPVPLKEISSNTISPSFGKEIMEKGLWAGFYGLVGVIIFLIIFYRFSGFLASIALISYVILTLSLFKFLGFVFTAAGIAGFIISIGMAVDANVLIFEMTREKLKEGKKLNEAIDLGFKQAWLSIRDGNLSSIITAIILFYMTTSLVQGFALTFGIGVLTSMFSAIVLTRSFLKAVTYKKEGKKFRNFLFGKI